MPLDKDTAEALFESFQFSTKKKDEQVIACIQSFLDQGISLKEIVDKGGNTLLHQATARGKPAAARLLIENGLDHKTLNSFGKSSLGIAEDFRGSGKAYRELFIFLRDEAGPLVEQQVAAAAVPETLASGKRKRGEADAVEEGSAEAPNARVRVGSEAGAVLGKRVTKEFPGHGYYEGVVTCDEGERGLMVVFEDKTVEYLPLEEVKAIIERYEKWHGQTTAPVTGRGAVKKEDRQPNLPKISNKNQRPGAKPAEGCERDATLKRVQVLHLPPV